MTELELNQAAEKWQAALVAQTRRFAEVKFSGQIRRDGIRRQLVPNQKNQALMDVANVTSYVALFTILNAGAKRRHQEWVWVADDVERIEIGTYKNQQ